MKYLDGIGSYHVGRAQVVTVILEPGEVVIRDREGVAVLAISLSGSGRKLKMIIRERVQCGSGPEGVWVIN